MTDQDPRHLLEIAGVVRHPCDLDLLLFFARHPRVLLASESLASFLGYDMKVIARSLDGLLAAGLLTRRQSATHAARLYVFTGGAPEAAWLSALVQMASTRQGRRTLLAVLNSRTGAQGADGPLNEFEYGRAAVNGPRPVERLHGQPVARQDVHVRGGREHRGDDDDA